MTKRGLYIHIPFCLRKCDYCDFYSFSPSEGQLDAYLSALIARFPQWSTLDFDTVYLGGGTPSVLPAQKLNRLLKSIAASFTLRPGAEITMEANPSSASPELFKAAFDGSVNRISLGLQSAIDGERRALGRLSGAEQALAAVSAARKAKIENISVDIMLGVPGQTKESLKRTLDFVLGLGVPHVSAYMLKLERGTRLFERRHSLALLSEDEVCELYLYACDCLGSNGYNHYEISNFALPGYESRHNLIYWTCGEYLGLGPSAHSFIGSERFHYERSFSDFISGAEPVSDGRGGGFDEYLMLGLRLKQGVSLSKLSRLSGAPLSESFMAAAEHFAAGGLASLDGDRLSLTENGFLLSNSIIAELSLAADEN